MLQSLPTLLDELILLVDRGDPTDYPTLVVENCVCHMVRNAKLRHMRHNRAPYVVQTPIANVGNLVYLSFCLRESADRRLAGGCEHKVADQSIRIGELRQSDEKSNGIILPTAERRVEYAPRDAETLR